MIAVGLGALNGTPLIFVVLSGSKSKPNSFNFGLIDGLLMSLTILTQMVPGACLMRAFRPESSWSAMVIRHEVG